LTLESLKFVYTTSQQATSLLCDHAGLFENASAKILNVSPDVCVAFRGLEPVAFAALVIAPKFQRIHIEFLEVSENARDQKVGSQMLNDIFQRAHEMQGHERASVTTCGFTELGKKYLIKVLDRLTNEFPDVEFVSIPTA
jgi:ribosomal protein S18 acetylase RimI-like enzyme